MWLVATLEKGFDILHSNESDHLDSEISEDYISIMLNLATYFQEVEQFEKSISYLQKMYSFAVEDNKIMFAKISLHFQSNYFASIEDFENLEITCQLHDSLNDGEDLIMDTYKEILSTRKSMPKKTSSSRKLTPLKTGSNSEKYSVQYHSRASKRHHIFQIEIDEDVYLIDIGPPKAISSAMNCKVSLDGEFLPDQKLSYVLKESAWAASFKGYFVLPDGTSIDLHIRFTMRYGIKLVKFTFPDGSVIQPVVPKK